MTGHVIMQPLCEALDERRYHIKGFSKAYDSVNHQLLLATIKGYEIAPLNFMLNFQANVISVQPKAWGLCRPRLC